MFIIWFLLVISATTALAAIMSAVLNPSGPKLFSGRTMRVLATSWTVSAVGSLLFVGFLR